jgi:4-hydroxybenzoate polyprenyltransferase
VSGDSASLRPVVLLRATHPEPAAAVTATAALLAFAVGHRPSTAALVTLTVAASQLATGWANDAIDAGRDRAVGRTGKPIVDGLVSRRTVAVAAAVAAAATVPLALSLGPAAAAAAGIGLASALAYDWPLKLTPLSPLPYAVSFAALPAFTVLAVPATPPWWLVAAGGLLGTGAHFANALPDLADDLATGVRGLPQRLGRTGSGLAAAGLLLAATVVLVAGPPGPPTWAGLAALLGAAVVLPAGWVAGRVAAAAGRRPTALFRAFLAVAVIDVGLLLVGGSTVV